MSWEIRQGDALAILRTMPDSSIDACVTDPEYGEGIATWDRRRSVAWHELWIREVDRVLRRGAPLVAFASRRYGDVFATALRSVRGDSPDLPLQQGVWIHRQGHPTGSDAFLRPEHEPWYSSGPLRATADDVRACRTYRTPHTISKKPITRRITSRAFKPITYTPHPEGPMGGTVFECARNKPGEALGHPTQKPLAITAYLVCLASEPGALVLDLFCGSATTGEAALRSGRRFIGIEREPVYCEMGRARLRSFDVRVPAEAAS